MASPIIQTIQRRLDDLSRSERRVGEWVLANTPRAVNASILEVAHAADVSEPTVIRFCRSVGVSGFRELKTLLIGALQRPESHLHRDVRPGDDLTDAAGKVLESSVQALVDLRSALPGMPFQAAVSSMIGARQLVFAGLGASGIVASDARHKFFRLGKPCTVATDSPTVMQQASIVDPRDAIVVISHTGQWPELVDAATLAAARSATVIALTDPHSPLASAAKIVFDCHPHEDTNAFTPMTSRITQLVLLDALQVGLALKLGPDAEDKLRRSKAALGRVRP